MRTKSVYTLNAAIGAFKRKKGYATVFSSLILTKRKAANFAKQL
jgi:hypothetical protein